MVAPAGADAQRVEADVDRGDSGGEWGDVLGEARRPGLSTTGVGNLPWNVVDGRSIQHFAVSADEVNIDVRARRRFGKAEAVNRASNTESARLRASGASHHDLG